MKEQRAEIVGRHRDSFVLYTEPARVTDPARGILGARDRPGLRPPPRARAQRPGSRPRRRRRRPRRPPPLAPRGARARRRRPPLAGARRAGAPPSPWPPRPAASSSFWHRLPTRPAGHRVPCSPPRWPSRAAAPRLRRSPLSPPVAGGRARTRRAGPPARAARRGAGLRRERGGHQSCRREAGRPGGPPRPRRAPSGGHRRLGGRARSISRRSCSRAATQPWPARALAAFSRLALGAVPRSPSPGPRSRWPMWARSTPWWARPTAGCSPPSSCSSRGSSGWARSTCAAVRRLPPGRAVLPARLRRFVEVEAGLGVTLLFVAASLGSAPPAVDVVADRATPAEVLARFTPRWPHLTTPEPRRARGRLRPRRSARPAHDGGHRVVRVQPQRRRAPRARPRPARRAGPAGRHRLGAPLAPGLPALSVFLLFRSDPGSWPLSETQTFIEGLTDPEVLQHRVFALLPAALGLFEWLVQERRLGRRALGARLPAALRRGRRAPPRPRASAGAREGGLPDGDDAPAAGRSSPCSSAGRAGSSCGCPRAERRIPGRIWPPALAPDRPPAGPLPRGLSGAGARRRAAGRCARGRAGALGRQRGDDAPLGRARRDEVHRCDPTATPVNRSAVQNVSRASAKGRAEAQHAPRPVEQRRPAPGVELERAGGLDRALVHEEIAGPRARGHLRGEPRPPRGRRRGRRGPRPRAAPWRAWSPRPWPPPRRRAPRPGAGRPSDRPAPPRPRRAPAAASPSRTANCGQSASSVTPEAAWSPCAR